MYISRIIQHNNENTDKYSKIQIQFIKKIESYVAL